MKLWHWQLLGLTAFFMPLAVTGTAAAISHGHAALVVAPATLYIVLVARLVRCASSAAIDPPQPHGEDARSAGTKAPRRWRHRENGTSVPGDAADPAWTRGTASGDATGRDRVPVWRPTSVGGPGPAVNRPAVANVVYRAGHRKEPT